ncbi:MAG: TonB family protein [Acidobacteriota bacterium]
MFETSVISVQTRAADRRYGLLTLSVAAHAAIIIAIVAASIAQTKLPENAPNQMIIPFIQSIPPALGTPDAKPAPKPATPRLPQAPRVPMPQTVTAPQTIPSTTETAAASNSSGDAATTGTGDPGPVGVPWGDPTGVGVDGPPAGPATIEQSDPLPVRGDVKAPIVLRRVQPVYPRPALFARMNGFVIVECIIDRTGVVRDAKVLRSSSAMFEPPALEAVQQWQFSPGSLHGRPVDTIFNLTVTFTISR